MLFQPYYDNSFASQVASFGTTRPASAMGTSITPGTASEGAWTAIGSALTGDCYFLIVNINSGTTSTVPRNYVMDIGADPSGGTSYTEIVTDLLCGGAVQSNAVPTSVSFSFPLFIPSGATLAMRAKGTNASTINAFIITYQKPTGIPKVGSFVETIGVTPGAIVGTAITPGTTSEGSWTSIGTTVNNLWSWQVSIQVDASDASWNTTVLALDLAVGDGSNFDIISNNTLGLVLSVESMAISSYGIGIQRFVPAGSTMYLRAQASSALDSYTAAVYGVGG